MASSVSWRANASPSTLATACHKIDVLGAEVAYLEGVQAEHAEGGAAALDHYRQAAAGAEIAEDGRAIKARLGRPVTHDNRPLGEDRVTGLGGPVGRDFHARHVREAERGAKLEGVSAGKQLDHCGNLELEQLRRCPHGLGHQV